MKLNTTFYTALLMYGIHLPFAWGATTLQLSSLPLALGNSVPANVFIQLDDSGSMDWEILMRPFWEACAYDPNITGIYIPTAVCGTYWTDDSGLRSYGNGSFRNFYYLFNNPGNIYGNTCSSGSGINNIAICPQAGTLDWRAFSSSANTTYYDPTVAYTPWIGNCSSSTPCADASFTAARSYPVANVSDYSTTQSLVGNRYSVWIDDRGFTGTRPLRALSVNANLTPNGLVDLWDSHIDIVLNSSNVQVFSVVYAPTALGLQAVTTLRATLSSSTACYNVLGSNDLVTDTFNGLTSYTATDGEGCRTIAQAKQNYANWYQYSRRRSMAARGSIGYIIDQFPSFRYGVNTINNAFFIPNSPLPAQDYTSYNNNIVQTIYNMGWNALGTPLRSALDRVGQYYAGTLSGTTTPITESCQQNYTILFTDGYWSGGDSISSGVGDVDGDGYSKTLADVARYYYINDLSTLSNNQSPNQWDTATWQHMVTFTVGFGLNGLLTAGTNGWPTPALQENSNWGDPFNNVASKADDLWHAAFNSKGAFLSAQSPAQVQQSLSEILSAIFVRSVSASSAAQNSSVVSANAKVYQSTFDSGSWLGNLYAYNFDNNGSLNSTPQWNANCILTGGSCPLPLGTNPGITPNNRVIITRNWTGANNGIAFRFPSNYTTYKSNGVYPTNLTNFLTYAPNPITTTKSAQINANQAYGQALLNFLRGDRSNESANNGAYQFRNRQGILGDIISSGAAFVGAPQRTYPDTLEASPYSTFKQTYASRAPLIYVGANDGMLHGFNADTGQELMAYVPGDRQIFKNLPTLSKSTYAHSFFVDGSPAVGDAYLNSAWRTILVGNLRNGGQSIFALDVTNPTNFSETNASSTYLWEFTDKDDPDLGYVYSTPVIGKVRNGNQTQWAVIIGNGYNNMQSDGYVSSTGKSHLFILFIQQGIGGTWAVNQNYIKIPLGSIPANATGLGTPYPVDIDGDFIIDYVYAGDLQGNLWRVDLRSTTPTSWASTATNVFTASASAAGDQAITAPLVVAPHPNGIQNGVMVYFGTGKYLEPNDTTQAQATQSFYGIWDKLDNVKVTKAQLLQQQIVAEITPVGSTNTFRAVSNNNINWVNPNQNRGWYLNLIVQGSSSNGGERQVTQPILRNGNIIFTTLIPSSSVCAFGGSSWLMELNAENGGAPLSTPFDLNNDGQFTSADYINIGTSSNTNYVTAAGMRSPVGVIPTPAILLSSDKGKEVKVLSGSQGIKSIDENIGTATGRQNWRQIY